MYVALVYLKKIIEQWEKSFASNCFLNTLHKDSLNNRICGDMSASTPFLNLKLSLLLTSEKEEGTIYSS